MGSLMNKKAVVVTTKHRGVFFGYIDGPPANGNITLSDARMCVYWPAENHGVLGLAADGPKGGSKISPAVSSIELTNITAVMDCTPEAVAAWESEPWS